MMCYNIFTCLAACVLCFIGGPLREYLFLIVDEIARNNSLFTGDLKSRVPAHNALELSKKTFQHVGTILALSLVYGGPAPHFFAESVADYIAYGLDKTRGTIDDIPDFTIKQKMAKVSGAYSLMYFNFLPPGV